MSKQSEAKQKMNWQPTAPMCETCRHYELTAMYGRKCGLGGFATKARAVCDLHETKEEQPVVIAPLEK